MLDAAARIIRQLPVNDKHKTSVSCVVWLPLFDELVKRMLTKCRQLLRTQVFERMMLTWNCIKESN